MKLFWFTPVREVIVFLRKTAKIALLVYLIYSPICKHKDELSQLEVISYCYVYVPGQNSAAPWGSYIWSVA